MSKTLFIVVVALCACGGGKKKEDTTGGGVTIDPNATSGDTTDRSGSMIPPEKMDEITRLLDRKRPTVSRCLTMVVDNQELPKGSRGKMTLGITISPSGKASKVAVIKSTLESKKLEECVIGKINEIDFPQIPSQYETTYAYAFEAIQ
ncbi:MAG: AgmX/PglI C-terminal domain-containing protein [Myxococcota bacterium]|nr:AgmX/PglI C-terminal domain-containing protein [Deltaproteobacteria bacterium]MDQ3334304.1 AgmX/PglI C-terminal domain-containing protein [Myxococcota bacterium]